MKRKESQNQSQQQQKAIKKIFEIAGKGRGNWKTIAQKNGGGGERDEEQERNVVKGGRQDRCGDPGRILNNPDHHNPSQK